MIRVEVQDYCQSCLEFEPDVENPTLFYAAFEVVEQTDTVIRCKHRTRCENIKHYIDKENGGNSMENIKRVGEGFTEKDEYDAYDISIKNLRTEKPIHP